MDNTKNYLNDPLFMVSSKMPCPVCGGDRKKRKNCPPCQSSGFTPIPLNGLWWPSPGFLVCGGPSLNKIPFQKLKERGIVSLAVNNVAGYAPVSAWCFSDPQNKFHHAIYLDPKCLTFAPIPKLRKHLNVKMPNGTFRVGDMRVMDCPASFGFNRRTVFNAKTFLTTPYAHWGHGGKDSERPFTLLETMLLGLRLMHYLGCPRVYMLGVDHHMTQEAQYSFNQTKPPRDGRYKKANEMLKELRPVFEAVGFQVFNCNPESHCDAFDKVSFDQAFQDCQGAVPQEPWDLSKWYDKHIAEEHIKVNPEPVTLDQLRESNRTNPSVTPPSADKCNLCPRHCDINSLEKIGNNTVLCKGFQNKGEIEAEHDMMALGMWECKACGNKNNTPPDTIVCNCPKCGAPRKFDLVTPTPQQ